MVYFDWFIGLMACQLLLGYLMPKLEFFFCKQLTIFKWLMIIVFCKQLLFQVAISNTNNLHTVILIQEFLSNSNNLLIIMSWQLYLHIMIITPPPKNRCRTESDTWQTKKINESSQCGLFFVFSRRRKSV